MTDSDLLLAIHSNALLLVATSRLIQVACVYPIVYPIAYPIAYPTDYPIAYPQGLNRIL